MNPELIFKIASISLLGYLLISIFFRNNLAWKLIQELIKRSHTEKMATLDRMYEAGEDLELFKNIPTIAESLKSFPHQLSIVFNPLHWPKKKLEDFKEYKPLMEKLK